jgi:acyl-CoA thioesterase-2
VKPDTRSFVGLMTLEPHGADAFVGISPRYEWGRLYGGQVVAQALRAACLTVDDDHRVHSLHAYFIRGGSTDEPVRYEVDRVRNGRSFMTRRVVARQSGGAILTLEASYQLREEEADVQTAQMPPNIPAPDRLEPDGWGWMMDRRPIDHRIGSGQATGWVRITEELPDDHDLLACGLAFTSDTIQFGSARSAHPLQVPRAEHRQAFMGASLDHAIWFHRPLRPDHWHLFDFTCRTLTGARGITIGDVFAADGTHAATVAQEVLLRVRRPGAGRPVEADEPL